MAQKRLRYGENDVDIIVLTQGENVNPNVLYETKLDTDGLIFIKEGRKKRLYTYEMNYEIVKSRYNGKVEVINKDKLREILNMVKGKVVGIDEHIKPSLLLKIQKASKAIVDLSHAYCRKRAKKRGDEIKKIKKGAEETLDIIYSIDIEKMKTEKDIEKALIIETYERGYEPAFWPIVSSGTRTRFPHYRASKRRLGNAVLIDYGVKIDYYNSDITEMIFKNKSSKQYEIYERVMTAFEEIVHGIERDMTGNDVFNLYIDVFNRLNLPKMPHAIGHGIGLEVHECPTLIKGSEDEIIGSVIAIEPAVYTKSFGVRFERDIVVK